MGYARPNVHDIAYRRTVSRLVLIQAGLTGLAAAIALLLRGHESGLALLYGGAVSIAGTLAGAWRLKIATEEVAENAMQGVAEFYKSAVMRFVIVIALLGLGMGVLKLHALALLTGFIVAQTGYFFGRPLRAR
ncbi:MAG TPA: ATP synthase subunit I [Chromatiales bacterium]|nr:ATP synthase subunit I [Chromatiales bacterium]